MVRELASEPAVFQMGLRGEVLKVSSTGHKPSKRAEELSENKRKCPKLKAWCPP